MAASLAEVVAALELYLGKLAAVRTAAFGVAVELAAGSAAGIEVVHIVLVAEADPVAV